MTDTELVRSVFLGVLNTLWIASAIAAAAWALARFLPRTNAATRHLLWWTVLAFVLLVPFAVLDRPLAPVGDPAPPEASAAEPIAAAVPPASAATPEPARDFFPLELHTGDWMAIAVSLWLGFALLQFLRIAWSFLHLRKLKRQASAAPEALAARFQYWLAACGIRRPVRLLVSDRIASPLATGFRRPAVILPSALLAQFGEGELDHVLLHELAHVVRRDDWTNLLAHFVGALAGLHPAAAWTLRQIARERELACDDWVVARTGDARPYAASLTRMFELCRARRRAVLATGMAENRSRLGERIGSLLANGRHFSTRASLPRIGAAAVVLIALVAAGAQAPQWVVLAQNAAPPAGQPQTAQPVNPHGSFLAALVAAGYSSLSVDEIISLKDHGIDARFLADLSQAGWEKLRAPDMIEMHDHGVPPEMLRTLREAGFQHVEMRAVIHAFEQGVRPGTLKEAAQYGTHLRLDQIVRLKQAGVIQ